MSKRISFSYTTNPFVMAIYLFSMITAILFNDGTLTFEIGNEASS